MDCDSAATGQHGHIDYYTRRLCDWRQRCGHTGGWSRTEQRCILGRSVIVTFHRNRARTCARRRGQRTRPRAGWCHKKGHTHQIKVVLAVFQRAVGGPALLPRRGWRGGVLWLHHRHPLPRHQVGGGPHPPVVHPEVGVVGREVVRRKHEEHAVEVVHVGVRHPHAGNDRVAAPRQLHQCDDDDDDDGVHAGHFARDNIYEKCRVVSLSPADDVSPEAAAGCRACLPVSCLGSSRFSRKMSV